MTRILLLALTIVLVAAPCSRADISPATTIDGPSADILEVGGVAMAQDGTGGLVYRKRVDGVSHVFAAQYVDGQWQPPQRVDAGQRFDSSFAVIGAADDGILVVVWVQEYGTGTDRLYSAVLGRGAGSFQSPTPIDNSIGEATGTFPALAMNRGGGAFLAYSVITSADNSSALPPGYVTVDRRLARFNGQYWTGLGASFARQPTVPVRRPTAVNAPRIAIDTTGNGIVAWQEPDDAFVDRIWARRIFGSGLGVAYQVSPSTLGDKPLRGPADAFSLDSAGFGEGAIAFRQQPSSGAAIAKPIDMVALIPETFAEDAGKFGAAQVLDGDQTPAGGPGPPSVAVTAEGAFLSGFSADRAAMLATGDESKVEAPTRIDGGRSSVTPDPQVDLAASGAAAVAFPVSVDRQAGVEVHELRADGVPGQRTVSADRGGEVASLALAGTGLGDALLAFRQGTGAGTQVGAAAVDAPPDAFTVQTPIGWVNAQRVKLRWDDATHAIGGVTYAVTVDDQVAAENLTGTTYTLKGDDFATGRQTVAVIATDSAGQQTTSDPAELKVDRTPPRVTLVARAGRRVAVRLSDPQSGLQTSSTTLRIGPGKQLSGQSRYALKFRRTGRFRAYVRARDRAGNRLRLTRLVRVR